MFLKSNLVESRMPCQKFEPIGIIRIDINFDKNFAQYVQNSCNS